MQSEIPRDQWQRFCDEFSRVHHGWQATLTRERGTAEALEEQTVFQGIAEEPGAQGDYLTLFTADHVGHMVRDPRTLYLLSTEDGTENGLRIEQADGGALVLRFRGDVPPEALDGVFDVD